MSDQDDSALDLFDDEQAERTIRRVWHDGRWFFSVIDVIGFLTESAQPRRYWTDMKRRLAEDEGFSEVYAKCVQLKMTALDGKQRLTEVADAETLLRIIQSVPSPKAEPFKQWLARVGTERLREMEDPALAAAELHQTHDAQGFSALQSDAREAGEVGGIARREVEARTGRPVVSPVNYMRLRQERQRELQPPLLDGPGDEGV